MGLTASYSEAILSGPWPVTGQPGDVHTEAKNALGAIAFDQFGNEYIYLKGVVNTLAGIAVTFDELGITTVLAANAIGPVAWATGAIVASTWGWYARRGNILGLQVAATADNSRVGRETTDGHVGDGRAAGDQIYGVIARSTTTGLAPLHVCTYPFVDDIYGS